MKKTDRNVEKSTQLKEKIRVLTEIFGEEPPDYALDLFDFDVTMSADQMKFVKGIFSESVSTSR